MNAGRRITGRDRPSGTSSGDGHDRRLGHAQARREHGLAEALAVLGAPDDVDRRSDQLDAEIVEDALLGELDGEVESGLAAHRRQQRVGPLALEHAGDALEIERLEVRPVGEPGSVMIVAGFELTTIVRNPSSRSTFSAWQPA